MKKKQSLKEQTHCNCLKYIACSSHEHVNEYKDGHDC